MATTNDHASPYGRSLTWWLTTTNHKGIGVLYLTTSLVFLVAAVTLAMLMKTQLSVPNNTFLSPDQYNEVFTMHGTTMVFLFGMPVLSSLANYFVPLMIGARDMIFPRLNAMSYWLYLVGGVLMYSSFLFGGAPNQGWFSYAPLTMETYSPGLAVDFWCVAITILGVSSIAGAVNVLATIVLMRAPGMTFNRMPLFIWGQLVNQVIILGALPSLTVAAILLYMDRHYGTAFFNPERGGDALLWQHLFWFFGHPEVYVLIVPIFGAISEIIPVFSRKPIFGYAFIAYSTVAIAFLSFTVWAHHMFAVGMSFTADAVFAFTSYLIAVPTAVKIFNWLATMWGGALRLTTSMLFAMGFIGLFLIGGLTGVAVAVVPFDWQITDSYFVVAHFHSTLFGGTAMGLFATIYYWFPKITGRLMDERLGKVNFLGTVIGFLVTFQPMFVLGLLGMPRRIFTYAPDRGWTDLNLISTIGAYILGFSILLLVINLVVSVFRGRPAGGDPWNAWTLEWSVSSPPPPHDFDTIPVVRSRRPLWDQKHPDQADYLTGHSG
jgi:cytochrome c oxidase subunit I